MIYYINGHVDGDKKIFTREEVRVNVYSENETSHMQRNRENSPLYQGHILA